MEGLNPIIGSNRAIAAQTQETVRKLPKIDKKMQKTVLSGLRKNLAEQPGDKMTAKVKDEVPKKAWSESKKTGTLMKRLLRKIKRKVQGKKAVAMEAYRKRVSARSKRKAAERNEKLIKKNVSKLGITNEYLAVIKMPKKSIKEINEAILGGSSSNEIKKLIKKKSEEEKNKIETLEKKFRMGDKFAANFFEEVRKIIEDGEISPLGFGNHLLKNYMDKGIKDEDKLLHQYADSILKEHSDFFDALKGFVKYCDFSGKDNGWANAFKELNSAYKRKNPAGTDDWEGYATLALMVHTEYHNPKVNKNLRRSKDEFISLMKGYTSKFIGLEKEQRVKLESSWGEMYDKILAGALNFGV